MSSYDKNKKKILWYKKSLKYNNLNELSTNSPVSRNVKTSNQDTI